MRVIDILLEASGGMWDRMHERRMGKNIQFSKNGVTLDLAEVQVFPQDPKLSSYKDQTGTQPDASTTVKSTKQPAAKTALAPLPKAIDPESIEPLEVEQELEPEQEKLAERAPATPVDVAHTQIMLDDVTAWIESQGAAIEYAPPPANSDAAAIVVILSGDGQPADPNDPESVETAPQKLAFVKWTKKKSTDMPPIFWKTIEFERASGWVQGNVGKSATAKAAAIKIDPSDFVVAEQKYAIGNIPNEVANNLASRGQEFPPELKAGIPALLNDLLSNSTPVPTSGIDHFHREIEVVLGETAAPIALANNKRVSGAYQDVAIQLLAPAELTWADFTEVAYGKKGGKLEDCTMYAGDFTLMVSSKDSTGGSPASLTGFVETLDKRPDEFGKGTPFHNKYRSILKIIRIIYDNSAKDGIVLAALALKIINSQEAGYIFSIYANGGGNMADAQNFPNLPDVIKAKKLIGQKIVNKAGQTVDAKIGVDVNNHKYQFGYHLLGNLAVLIKKKLNADVPKITKMFKAVLNRADMVQVYTTVKKNNQGIWYDNFNVVWPPTFSGTIQIESDHYTANAKAGKKISFVFK